MRKINKILFFLILIFFISVYTFALNKIRYKDFNWFIYETDNFYVYYYKGAEFLAKISAIYAEEAYNKISRELNFKSKEKIPLFIYDSHQAFTTTNITLSFLGEGTGGFTEMFKNRVVLPGNGSLKSLRQVIFHEITHAFQYKLIYGEGGMLSYASLYKDLFIPLWVMEGSAEYFADDFDTIGDMILRDAVINNRLISIDKLDGFSHLEEVYLAYKEAQSIYIYLANKYGKERIGEFLNGFRGDAGLDIIFKKVFKKEFSDFQKEWEFYLKKKYWTQVQGRDKPEKYGPKLTENNHNYIVYNQAPSLSPDGKYIAFISTRDGNRAIYIMRNDGKEMRQVFGNRFEGISTDGFPISWSNDNKTIYFVSKEKGRKYIFKGNIETGNLEKIIIPEFDVLYSPAISPDERYIAFIGLKDGFSDVYIHDTEKKETMNITRNIFANNYVSWSKNGDMLVFTEERNDYNRLVIFDIKSGNKKFLTKIVKYDYLAPKFLNDKELVCISDKNGVLNVYKIDIKNGNEYQLTNVINGIFGISVSDNYIVYSYYEDACYNIYKYLISKKYEFTKIPLIYNEAFLENKEKKEEKFFNYEKKYTPIIKMPEEGDDIEFKEEIEEIAKKTIKNNEEYTIKFTPDIFFALLGFSTDTGPVGGAYILASDMLGDNNLGLLANFIPGYFSQFEFNYLFLKLPFDIGFNFFYYQNIYKLYDIRTNSFFSQLDTTEIGGSIQISYPLSLYANLGLSLGTKRITDKYINYDTSSIYSFNENESNILNTLAFYFVNDFSSWRDFWTYSGDFILFYVEMSDKIFGGTKTYTIYEIDLRKYFDLSSFIYKNLSFNLRILGAMTEGNDKPYFLCGGLNTIRGLKYGEYIGDKVLITNYELRYTLAKNFDFSIWPLQFLMFKNLKIALFDDAGIVKSGIIDKLTNEEIKNGIGMSLIIDAFLIQRQFLPLRFDIARRTDIGDSSWKFYFSFSTGF